MHLPRVSTTTTDMIQTSANIDSIPIIRFDTWICQSYRRIM